MQMKTLTTIATLTLTSIGCFGQNQQPRELGIGFIIASDPYKYENGSHYDRFFTDKGLTTRWTGANIFPFFYKPDYALYHFICLEKTTKYYKLLINDSSTAYVANDASFYFKTWDMMLMDASVKRLSTDNPIKEKWTNESRTVTYNCKSGQLQVEDVIEIGGQYWLHVSFSPTCEDAIDQNAQRKYGWIKWRTKDKLLVDILLLC